MPRKDVRAAAAGGCGRWHSRRWLEKIGLLTELGLLARAQG